MKPTLQFSKTFTRKIVLGQIAYAVTHDGERGFITIKDTNRNRWLYLYDTTNNTPMYEKENLETIKHIFERAHIERYLL